MRLVQCMPPGRYNLSASKAGFVIVSYGQVRTSQPGQSIDLKNNAILEHADFNVPRAAVITGWVTDESVDPVADVS
jgi:hypothetical protein